MKTLNRVLTLLVALVLAVFGIVLAVEAVVTVFGSNPVLVDWRPAYRSGRTDTWDSTIVRTVAVVVTVVGLILLLLELKPRRVRRLRVSSQDPNTDAAVTRAGLRSALRRAAEGVDGITRASVKVGRRTAKVTAQSRGGQAQLASGLDAEVREAVTDRLAALQLRRPPRPRTSVQTRKDRS